MKKGRSTEADVRFAFAVLLLVATVSLVCHSITQTPLVVSGITKRAARTFSGPSIIAMIERS
jgi:hypothetical protein